MVNQAPESILPAPVKRCAGLLIELDGHAVKVVHQAVLTIEHMNQVVPVSIVDRADFTAPAHANAGSVIH